MGGGWTPWVNSGERRGALTLIGAAKQWKDGALINLAGPPSPLKEGPACCPAGRCASLAPQHAAAVHSSPHSGEATIYHSGEAPIYHRAGV